MGRAEKLQNLDLMQSASDHLISLEFIDIIRPTVFNIFSRENIYFNNRNEKI